jgi:hypothetical protein
MVKISVPLTRPANARFADAILVHIYDIYFSQMRYLAAS